MSKKEEKICPFSIASPYNELCSCLGSKCALYNIQYEKCAFYTIPRVAERIADALSFVAQNLELMRK